MRAAQFVRLTKLLVPSELESLKAILEAEYCESERQDAREDEDESASFNNNKQTNKSS